MFIPERQREALMRLTMCARDECMMCAYQPKDARCKDIATTAMNILANALEVDDDDTTQTERPSCETCRYDSEEPYNEKCDECVARGDKPSNYEPQTDCSWGEVK